MPDCVQLPNPTGVTTKDKSRASLCFVEVHGQRDSHAAVAKPGWAKAKPYYIGESLNQPRREWLVEDLLHKGAVSVLYGATGTGKTFVAMDLAMSVATGTPFMGRNVSKGNVFYVISEGRGTFSDRAHAWLKSRGLSRADLRGRFCVWPGTFKLGRGDDQGRLRESIREMLPDGEVNLIALDTLAMNFVGDENSNGDMTKFFEDLGELSVEFGAGVMAVHHTGHRSPLQERGGSALRCSVDTSMCLLKPSGAGLNRVLKCSKQREADEFGQIAVELERVRLPESDYIDQWGKTKEVSTLAAKLGESVQEYESTPGKLFDGVIGEILRSSGIVEGEGNLLSMVKDAWPDETGKAPSTRSLKSLLKERVKCRAIVMDDEKQKRKFSLPNERTSA